MNVEAIHPELPLEDKILIVRGLVVKARKCRKLRKRYPKDTQQGEAQRGALAYEAAECDRVARTLCEAWGLLWQERK